MKNQSIIRNFGVLYRTFLNYVSKSIASKDLSFSDSVFLVNIGEREGISQETIAANLAIDKAAIARSVKSMEQKGFLRTKKSGNDKRVKELYLTDTGKELLQYMLHLQEEWLKQVLASLTSSEIEAFERMIDDMSEKAKKVKC